MTPPGPSTQRIEILDVIRAVALFLILETNIVVGFRVPQVFAPGILPMDKPRLDIVARHLQVTFWADKGRALFSLLFGAGLAMIVDRARGDGLNPSWRYARRIAALLLLGLAHYLCIWEGDVLVIYSIGALLMVPFLFWRSRWFALVFAVLFTLVFPVLYWWRPDLLPQQADSAQKYYTALQVYGHGTYAQAVALRWHKLLWQGHALVPFVVPETAGNMLFGIVLWRSKGLECPVKRWRRALLIAAAAVVLGAALIAARRLDLFPHYRRALRTWWILLLTPFSLGYAIVLVVFYQNPHARCLLKHLAPVGRMAVTNYLSQSLVLTSVFYGYGLGRLGQVGVAAALWMGASLFVLQIVSSKWWLRRHEFGPVEWLWRSVTYWRWMPWVKLDAAQTQRRDDREGATS